MGLTHPLKEEGVADIQAYKDYYVPMKLGSLEDGAKKISKQELTRAFLVYFAYFGQEKDGRLLLLSVTNFT